MSTLAKVVIVGRMNVGKSTLFNRLSVDVKSLTLDFEGVTRDFIADVVTWQTTSFELIDSGGISMRKFPDELSEHVRQLGLNLIQSADLVLFVVDAKAGLLVEDQEIARFLHNQQKDVIVVVNKVDTTDIESEIYEFNQFGFKALYGISAQHGRGIAELLDAIVAKIIKKKIVHDEQEPQCRIAIVGKPNVGKSSLMNLLLDKERSLVSSIAGTTREAITESLVFYKETLALTDTPGVRRKRGVTESLEIMMVKTAFRAVQNADIVLLMIDGSAAQMSDQELKLLFYAFEQQHKAVVLLVNKDDLMDDYKHETLKHDFELYQRILKKLPILTISCKTGKNVGKILTLVQKVWQRYSQQLDNEELNTTLKNALAKKPLYHTTFSLVLYKAKQIKTRPITIVLFVNEPKWFGPSQIGFFENVLRKHYDLVGVPIQWMVRKR